MGKHDNQSYVHKLAHKENNRLCTEVLYLEKKHTFSGVAALGLIELYVERWQAFKIDA